MLKNLNVVLRAVSSFRLAWLSINWSHKRNEFIWNNPVQIAVFNSLIILVLFIIKLSKVVPTETNSELKTLQTMENCAFVSASVAIASITERFELRMIERKCLPNCLRCLFKHNYHEGPHQVASVDVLVVLGGAVVEQFNVFVAFIREQPAQFADILVGTCEIQWTEIRVERLIDQLVVHIVKVGL